MAERIAVILGAGASYDVALGTTPTPNQKWRPPLVSDLFDSRFLEIQQRYPGAYFHIDDLDIRAKKGAEGVEEMLRQLAESHDKQTRTNYLGIPPYLRDVLWSASQPRDVRGGPASPGYIERPSAYSVLVQRLLVDANAPTFRREGGSWDDPRVTFISLNYDTLLERALAMYSPDVFEFSSLSHYMDVDRPALVLKPHGSVNWWLPIELAKGTGWVDAASAAGLLETLRVSRRFADRQPAQSHSDKTSSLNAKISLAGDDFWAYPRITAPLSSKSELDLICPPDHLEVARSVLSTTHRYVFAGTSGWDLDVLGFLADSIPKTGGPTAEFVFGGAPGDLEARNRIIRGIPQLFNRESKEPRGDTYTGMFANWVQNERLMWSATAPLENLQENARKLGTS